MIKSCLTTICFLCLSIILCNGQSEAFKVPTDYAAQKDMIYTTVSDWEGLLDLYTPNGDLIPTPLLINIHGGGWNHGSKNTQSGFSEFFKNKFAVANINYRLVQQGHAPAAIQDVRCAVLYLINNAKQFNIDPNKIVLMGGSSGGHLALMAGMLQQDRSFNGNCSTNIPFSIVAIIDKYGVTDLTTSEVFNSASVKKWLGPNQHNLDFAKTVSPINYITKSTPAICIIHGDADPIVPYSQSVTLHNLLEENGIKNTFITVPNGQHGKFSSEDNKKLKLALWEFIDSLDL